MLEALNFIGYIAASAAATILYVISASPAQMERKIGAKAYQACGRYRIGSMIAMSIALVFFVLSRYLPLFNFLAVPFSWPRWLSYFLSILLALPALTVMITGMQDMGKETFQPCSDAKLKTKGIYQYIRHPQAYEALLWPAIAFGLHSPLLLALSFPWLLLEIIMVLSEEIDLVIRFGEPYIRYRARTGMFFPRKKLVIGFLKSVKDSINELFESEQKE